MNKVKAKDKIYMGCWCYERLQPNTKEFTRLAYTYWTPIYSKPDKTIGPKPSLSSTSESGRYCGLCERGKLGTGF